MTPEQVHNIARRRGWAPVRAGGRGRGHETVYRSEDVLAEVDRRLVQAEGQVENLRALRADLVGGRANG